MNQSITAILNCYKRPEYLEEQIQAIRSQTIKPSEIWLWVNASEENKIFDFENLNLDKIYRSSHNAKYHARFAIGLLAQTDYVALFDDDTIPGDRWLENCVNTMKTHPGILGGAGVILHTNSYIPNTKVGWHNNNLEIVEVDLVGHAWFLRRDDIKYMWYESPYTFENGEDIQLSYLAQKYGNIKTYCPPQPKNNLSFVSSTKPHYGLDAKASFGGLKTVNQHYKERIECVEHCVKNGWRLLNHEN